MALSASDIPTMYTLLANSLSGDQSVRKPAESALAQSESRPGFCSCLMEVISSRDLAAQVDVRLLASVYFKNTINRYWRNRRDSSSLQSSDSVKLAYDCFSFYCFHCIGYLLHEIALTLAVLISKIARIDYPKDWDTFHSLLIVVMCCQIPEISSHFFDYSWHLRQSDLQTILHGFSLLTQKASPNASELCHDDLYLTCERWLLCAKIICQLIISGFPSDTKSIQEVRPVKEVSPVLLNAIHSILPYYLPFQEPQAKLWEFLKRACTKLMKVLVAVQSRHPYSFGDKSVLPLVLDFCLNKITDPKPDIISFEQFLIQCMKLVKSVLEGKDYKPSLTGRVMDESGVTLELMKKNVSSIVAVVVTSLLPSDTVVLLCNVLIRSKHAKCMRDRATKHGSAFIPSVALASRGGGSLGGLDWA
ncbi:hypothetical protein RHSIM_Rhsim05G0217800 [Rhododendron simsii]|uniref:Importin N-terminal domain-containing protein n=1 Tax=Rhododendron simsii TaxID=118357 RepID=A0A834GWC9_RHOSS|nr:hypothetical protein RHSIM_Rhsim05G0217800 [Rhododendron simsii]